jgi:hypothetical protein
MKSTHLKWLPRRGLGVLLLSFLTLLPASGYFVDDFSSGLGNWLTDGDVAGVAGEVVLSDGQARLSLLFQPIPLPGGTYTVDVDVRQELSPDIPVGQLPDVFFASVYFVDDPGAFDLLGGRFDGAAALFDLAAGGFANVVGEVGASSKGPVWLHYRGTFELTHAYAIPTFELNDDNAVVADSQVFLDNLRIALIPEPLTLVNFPLGLVLLWVVRRRIGESPIPG